MRLTLNAKVLGLLIGAICGLLFVLLGWRSFLIFLAFAAFGLLVGLWLDLTPAVLRKVRDALTRFVS